MNQIELIAGLPNWKWKDHSHREIEMTGAQLAAGSDFVWRVGEVAIAGFIYNNFMSPPWMWFALAEGVGIRDLVDFRRLANDIPHGTLTAVQSDYEVGRRFARLYGFYETGELVDQNDHEYLIMRKV
jgi:hypothetical protein